MLTEYVLNSNPSGDMIGEIVDDRYRVLSPLGEGGMSTVYKALDLRTNQEIALKFLKRGITSSYIEDVVRFQREVHTLSKLEHPKIVRIFGAGNYLGIPYLSMELLNGYNLRDILKVGKRFTIDEGIEIIWQITEALRYVHDNGVIHRDLKPGNIMVLQEDHTYDIRVLDFGLALVLELKDIKDEEEMVGTFSYMSPEATGIMHKPMDERSDLYSLGIIFYQIITGILPFKGKKITTIIHQHIAKTPVMPTEFAHKLPKIIEEIILKLLQKDPPARYQTAKGLLADLERFKKGEIYFSLGKKDRTKQLSYITSFIDREEEFGLIQNLFNEVKAGKGHLCLIAGEAGCGKTRLVNELGAFTYAAGAIFLDGKCLRQENKPAYQPFQNILNAYIRYIKESPEELKIKLITHLVEIIGINGRIIETISPLIKDLIGESPPLIKLEPKIEQQRLLNVLSNFFCSLPTKEAPLVFYIDDLQWCDEASMKLIYELISKIKYSHLLIIGSYRTKDISGLPLISLLKDKAKGYPVTEIPLSLFDINKTKQLISQLLGYTQETEVVLEVSRYIQERSNGNPFFIIEITRTLVDEGILIFNEDGWILDKVKLQSSSLPISVVDVILKRIRALNNEEMDILSYGAIIGKEFNLNLVFSLTDVDRIKVVDIIDRCVKYQFIEWKPGERIRLVFIHDQIRDAFVKQIDNTKIQAIHLKVARTLEDIYKEDLPSVTFSLAHHYYEGGDREKTLKYAILAGKAAKVSYANEEAEKYYKVALDILEKDGKGPIWLECTEELGEVYIASGKYDEAIEIFKDLAGYKKGDVEQANICRQICLAYYKKGYWKDSGEYGEKALQLLGEKLPVGKNMIRFYIIKNISVHLLHCLLPWKWRTRIIRIQDKRIQGIIEIYQPLIWVFALTDLNKLLVSILRIVNLGEIKLGRSRELGFALASYGGMCMSISLFKKAIKYHNIGLRMRRELNDSAGIGQSLQWLGYCHSWKGDYTNSDKYFHESMEIYQRIGNQWEFGMSNDGVAFNYFHRGDFEKAIEHHEIHLELSEKVGDSFGISESQSAISWCYIYLGKLDIAEELTKKALEIAEKQNSWFIKCITLTYYGEICIEQRKIDEAIRYLEEARRLDKKYWFIKNHSAALYPKLAEALYQKYLADENKENLKNLKTAVRESIKETHRLPNRYSETLRIKAKELTLLRKKTSARRYFTKAISLAGRFSQRYELAKGLYEFGRWLWREEREDQAKERLQRAYNIFQDIKAGLYIKRTAELLGLKIEETGPQKRLKMEIDLNTLLETGQYLSSILNLDELLNKIIDSAMEITGAERGFLMLYPEEEKEHKLEVVVSRNVEDVKLKNSSLEISTMIINEVERKKCPRIIIDATSDKGLKSHISVVKYGLRSILCVPLINMGVLIGIIYLDNRLVAGLFSKRELDILTTLSNQAAISIQNAQLYKKAITDGLTGVYNHVFFQQKLEDEIKKSKSNKIPLCILLIDIDHFKRFNDQYGHHIGDAILRSTADSFKKEVDKRGIVARYGGEEFVVILPSVTLKEAEELGDVLRQKTAEFKLPYNKEEQLSVTISIGIAELKDGMDRLDLVKHADKALYRAKSLGRNRVET